MKRALFIALGALACFAQDKKAVLKDTEVAADWIYDDLPAAIARAKKEDKPLFVVFR